MSTSTDPQVAERPTTKLKVKIYYECTDAGGLVHHSNYLRYFERGREHLLGQQALVRLFESTGKSFVVTSVKIAYKRGASHGDEVDVVTIPERDGEYRLRFSQNVYRGDILLVQGLVEMVCVDREMKLTKLPEVITGKLSFDDDDSIHKSRVLATSTTKKRLPLPSSRRKLPSDDASFLSNSSVWMKCYLDDTDFTGVCYYANYLKWCERARAEILSLDLLAKMRREDGVGAAIHSAELDFKRGANFGDCILVSTRTKILSEFRVQFRHEIFRVAGDDKDRRDLLVRATVTIVCLGDGGSGTIMKIPGVFFERIRADAAKTKRGEESEK